MVGQYGRIDIAALASLPGWYLVTPSPDGEVAAFFSERTGRLELYTKRVAGGPLVQLTDGEAPSALRAGFEWAPDGSAIVFARDVDGNEQHNLFRLNVETGAVEQLNDDPATQEHPGPVAPDGASMLVTSNRNGQVNLFRLDFATRSWTQLTHLPSPVHEPLWSPDGRRIAFSSNESRNLTNLDGYVMDAAGGTPQKVWTTREGAVDSVDAWHPDGTRLAVTSDESGVNRVGWMAVDGGADSIKWLTPSGRDEYAVGFSADGRWLLAIGNHEASRTPVLYEVPTGTRRELDLPAGTTTAARFAEGGRSLLITLTEPHRRAHVLRYDLATDEHHEWLEADYGDIDPDWFANAEYVTYPSTGGVMVPALVYRPAGWSPGERRPAIVMPHGGPTGQYFRTFDLQVQFLQDRGYVVLLPNVRGSTGYGVDWRDACLKDWGGPDLDDVAAGARYLASRPDVDPDRLGVFGGSYGGYLSFMAVTKTPDVFKVGIPVVGISDLPLLYEEDMEHFKYYLRQQMGDPKENEALWRDRSATTFAHQTRAKLLILHGLNDPRCPISQARVFRDLLLKNGKREGQEDAADFEYHEFDEGHGTAQKPESRMRNLRLIEDFLARRL